MQRTRVQHAGRVAEPDDAGAVQDVRIDAGDLRRDVGAQAEQPAGDLVDELQRAQVEVGA
ncbi:MAG: hypothetical protein H6R03_1704, partial [Burkholderiaceae bacterium]|nr:hypothetical protein [Burkholderiaceae bacterium]